ncbi:MAG: UDP-N-acetylglucosamine--N-acetylmuramyl-(pentapeptide) pyrophosphoryl-undecaprenol N-acetylglucosamine transferase, partial [Deltaproteobacteria bacterium]|nr:UDP-N-acetylglucosamine--N-acetylmuramyl-(pentapeptide) pyrophosphoryl-undecaprenol N-acetylglucosamine transferase [Deltaproteobacteria bacterium]
CGRPAVLVPFPFAAHDHQMKNARALEKRGAALVLPQAELTPERLAALIGELLDDQARLRKMGAAFRALARPDAAGNIVRECLRCTEKNRAAAQ